jgi:hypothetical protein
MAKRELIAYLARIDRRLDIVSTIIMSLTAVLTAWSGYQSSLWESRRTIALADASTAKREATRLDARASHQYSIDLGLFQSYLQARMHGDAKVAEFYEQHFPPHLKQPIEDWKALQPERNSDAPANPFSLPSYVIPQAAAAEREMNMGFTLDAQARQASHHSSRYTRTTLGAALVLFFAGLAPKSQSRSARLLLLAIALIFLIGAVFTVVFLPVTFLGPLPAGVQ